jgi:SdrD B-like domain
MNPTTSKTVGPLVTTINYASIAENYASIAKGPTNYNRYLVGTVWNDANSNGRYDAGEGIGGVKVSLSAGGFYTITARAGGYALPLTDQGDVLITFSGTPTGTDPEPQHISVGTQSVLLDLKIFAPKVAAKWTPVTHQLELSWAGGSAPFQVQRRSFSSATWENLGPELLLPKFTVSVTNSGELFRVRSW